MATISLQNLGVWIYKHQHEKVYYWDRILYIAENTNIYGCTLKRTYNHELFEVSWDARNNHFQLKIKQ